MNNFIEEVSWKGSEIDLVDAFIDLDEGCLNAFSNFRNEADEDLSRLSLLALECKQKMESYPGFCIVRGFDKICSATEDYVQVSNVLGRIIGTSVPQNKAGDHVVLVQDDGLSTKNPTHRGHKTNDYLDFHNDRCDIIILLCANQSSIGGVSSLVSAKFIHDYILETAPHHLETLYRPFPNHRRGEERKGESEWCMMPVFSVVENRFVCRFVKRFITDSGLIDNAPRLSEEQNAALEYMNAAVHDTSHHVQFKLLQGEALLINNHTLLHGRSEYKDLPGEPKRCLIRVWLSHKESRRLPDSFKELYHNVGAGEVRGGI